MGWDGNSMYQFGSMKEFMKKNYNFEYRAGVTNLLDYAVINRTTVYAALESITNAGVREVWACVILFRFSRTEYMKKDIAESMGPCEDACPLRILKLLTPTTNEYALSWRKRCYQRIQRGKFEMKEGLVLVNNQGGTCTLLDPYYGKYRWTCRYSNDGTMYQTTKRRLLQRGYTTEALLFEELL